MAEKNESIEKHAEIRPALTPDGRMNQLVSLAFDLVEQRLRDGTASSQETTSIIKWSTAREQLETERVRKELALVDAKTQQLQAQANIEKLYTEAIKAMRTYSGQDIDEEDNDESN